MSVEKNDLEFTKVSHLKGNKEGFLEYFSIRGSMYIYYPKYEYIHITSDPLGCIEVMCGDGWKVIPVLGYYCETNTVLTLSGGFTRWRKKKRYEYWSFTDILKARGELFVAAGPVAKVATTVYRFNVKGETIWADTSDGERWVTADQFCTYFNLYNTDTGEETPLRKEV